jgi:predicted Zn-dependent peptidase
MSPTYRKDVLDNGTRIVSESVRGARSFSLGFWVGVGSSAEPKSLSGVSHFIEHILFKGTKRRSAFDIANTMESVGGTIDAFAGRESTAFVCRCLPEHLRRSIDVVSDMLCNPAMRDAAIELEKAVVFEEIRNYEDSPEEVAHELITRSVWRQDPLAKPVLGTMDSVAGFNRKKVLPFFRENYVSGETIVAAAGRFDHKRLVDWVQRMLKIPERRREQDPEAYSGALPRIHNDKREVSQCYICIGAQGPSYTDGRRYATLLMSMILGGGMTSRLFQELREKRGLAYSVYCSSEFFGRNGIFVIFLAVDPKKAKESVARVCKELKRLKRHGVSTHELRSFKQQLKGSLLLSLESMNARMARLARQERYLGGYVPVETTLRQAMNVKRGSILEEAERILDPARLSLVSVGPSSTDFPTESDLDF